MAQKVFVSYKYADSQVAALPPVYLWERTTARSYVDAFVNRVKVTGTVVYKGEMENENNSGLSEAAIWEKLKDKIYDSSVTVVFISPGMRELGKSDADQWIPWEISYSLKEEMRKNRTSGTNALLFVILPDINGNYYYHNHMSHFKIVSENMLNGYAEVVQWNRFIGNISYYINCANMRKQRTPSYRIVKSV
ncbi:MAG: TIR domain-containing protein [Clostridia bacterium]|nr:TIR domain-containing protein [Clostridia bacterium]